MAATTAGVAIVPTFYFLFHFVTTALQIIYPIDPIISSPRKQWLRDMISLSAWPRSYTPGDFIPGHAWLTQLALIPSLVSAPSFTSSVVNTICGFPLLAYFCAKFGAVPATLMWVGSGVSALAYQQVMGWRTEDTLERGGFNRGLSKDRVILGPAAMTGMAICYSVLFFYKGLAATLPARVRAAPLQMNPNAVFGLGWLLIMWVTSVYSLARHTSVRSNKLFEDIDTDIQYKGQLINASPIGPTVYGTLLAGVIIRRHNAAAALAARRVQQGLVTMPASVRSRVQAAQAAQAAQATVGKAAV